MLVGRGWGCREARRLVESGWRYRPKSQTGSSPLHSSKLQTEPPSHRCRWRKRRVDEDHARSAERLDCGLYTLVEQLVPPPLPRASQCGPSVSRVLSPPLACELQSTGWGAGPGESAQLATPASSPARSRESAQLTE